MHLTQFSCYYERIYWKNKQRHPPSSGLLTTGIVIGEYSVCFGDLLYSSSTGDGASTVFTLYTSESQLQIITPKEKLCGLGDLFLNANTMKEMVITPKSKRLGTQQKDSDLLPQGQRQEVCHTTFSNFL